MKKFTLWVSLLAVGFVGLAVFSVRSSQAREEQAAQRAAFRTAITTSARAVSDEVSTLLTTRKLSAYALETMPREAIQLERDLREGKKSDINIGSVLDEYTYQCRYLIKAAREKIASEQSQKWATDMEALVNKVERASRGM